MILKQYLSIIVSRTYVRILNVGLDPAVIENRISIDLVILAGIISQEILKINASRLHLYIHLLLCFLSLSVRVLKGICVPTKYAFVLSGIQAVKI